jgi:DNA modification methylase
MCGDSFDDDARANLLDGQIADMALMDPPFAIYGSSTGIGSDIADDKMIRPFFAQLGFVIVQSIREFAHAYVCCDWRSWATIWDGMKAAKLSPKNCLVWNKGGGLGSMYSHCYELIGFFVRDPPQRAMSVDRKAGHRQVFKRNILDGHNRPTGDDRLHNAAKPIGMLAELIENSSDAGNLVLDLFNGSGSVIMAGEQTGRRVCAMEMEPAMCDVTVKRWESATGRAARRAR